MLDEWCQSMNQSQPQIGIHLFVVCKPMVNDVSKAALCATNASPASIATHGATASQARTQVLRRDRQGRAQHALRSRLGSNILRRRVWNLFKSSQHEHVSSKPAVSRRSGKHVGFQICFVLDGDILSRSMA